MLLKNESIVKMHKVDKDKKIIYGLLYENASLKKVMSQFVIVGKSLYILLRKSRRSHDKSKIGYEGKSHSKTHASKYVNM